MLRNLARHLVVTSVLFAPGVVFAQANAPAPTESTVPGDAKPGDAKPGDAKPADAKPADTKPADAKPADAKPADAPPPAPPTPVPPPPPPPPPPPTERDYWKANAQAGLIWLAGNSNSLAFSGLATVARDDKTNVVTLMGKGAYATSANPPDNNSPLAKPAAGNWLLSLRYDRLFGQPDSDGFRYNDFFLEGRIGQDNFAGIWLRPEATAGYGRFFIHQKLLSLRLELGANYQHQWAALDPAPGAVVPTNPINYGAGAEANYIGGRLALLFEEKLTPWASFLDNAELTVQGTPDAAAPASPSRVLFTNVASFTSQVTTRVSIKITDTIKVNSNPPAQAAPTPALQKWDNTLEVALAVTLL